MGKRDVPGVDDLFAAGYTVEDLLEQATPADLFLQRTGKVSFEGFETAEEGVWRYPKPFKKVVVPAFPVEMLPKVLREYSKDVARFTQTPIALAGGLSLGAVSTCVQGTYVVSPRVDWEEELVLWVVSLLESGERKTAAFNNYLGAFTYWQEELAQHLRPIIAKLEARQSRLRKRKDKAEKAYADADTPEKRKKAEKEAEEAAEELFKIHIPDIPNLLDRDVTTQALGGWLKDNGGRGAIWSDEGEIFANIAGRYQNNQQHPDTEAFLSGHSGGTISKRRASGESVHVPRARIAMNLSVQPTVIDDIPNKKFLRGKGLFARWNYARPKSLLGRRLTRQDAIKPENRAAYKKLITDLLGDPKVTEDNYQVLLGRASSEKIIRFSGEADDLIERFETWLEPYLGPYGGLEPIKDWAGKLAGNNVRIAGLLHIVKYHQAGYPQPHAYPVSEETLREAIHIGCYYLVHAWDILVGASDLATSDAEYLLGWLRGKGVSEIEERDLKQRLKNTSRFSDPEKVREALEVLWEMGYVRTSQPIRKKSSSKGGRKKLPTWEVSGREPESEDPPIWDPAADFFGWLSDHQGDDGGSPPEGGGPGGPTSQSQRSQKSQNSVDGHPGDGGEGPREEPPPAEAGVVVTNGHVKTTETSAIIEGATVAPSKKPKAKFKAKATATKKTKKTKPKKRKVAPAQPAVRFELAFANHRLSKDHNIVWKGRDVAGVLQWLRGVTEVEVDAETYGKPKEGEPWTKEWRKRLALSFVRSEIRLIQLHADGVTYYIDALLLPKSSVAEILSALEGKVLYGHNLIFDLPRFKRHFGVDLMEEDIRDSMVASRLVRAGEWRPGRNKEGQEVMVPIGHNLGECLRREKIARVSKETDHAWQEPLNEERLRYAHEDVAHLSALYEKLLKLVEERDQREGLELYREVYPIFMDMQYRGLPFNLEKFKTFVKAHQKRHDDALAYLEEHKPIHPEGGEWSWGNRHQPDALDKHGNRIGRNGALRALHELGIDLANTKKATRMEHLSRGEEPFLDALHRYRLSRDILGDCRNWETLSYDPADSRLYPNINPFSQETGRTAYSDPAIQNIPKERDEDLKLSLRDCIEAGPEDQIVKADYSAQELRIVAEISGDEDLIRVFAEGDPHLKIGEKLAGRELAEDDPEYEMYRGAGKAGNYGFNYGASWQTFQTATFEKTGERHKDEWCQALKGAHQKTWEGLKRWQNDFGPRDGSEDEHWFTVSWTNRRRYVSRKWDDNTWSDTFGTYIPSYTERLNGCVQQGGADMLYTSMILLRRAQKRGEHVETKISVVKHDELALEGPRSDTEAKGWLKETMTEGAARFLRPELVKGCVDAETGPSLGGK